MDEEKRKLKKAWARAIWLEELRRALERVNGKSTGIQSLDEELRKTTGWKKQKKK